MGSRGSGMGSTAPDCPLSVQSVRVYKWGCLGQNDRVGTPVLVTFSFEPVGFQG